MMRSGCCRPEGVGIAIECELFLGTVLRMFLDEIIAVANANGIAEFLKAGDIGVGNQAALIRRDAKHELSTAADGLVVGGHQLRYALQTCFIMRMPEPVILAQWRIGLDGAPSQISMAVDNV